MPAAAEASPARHESRRERREERHERHERERDRDRDRERQRTKIVGDYTLGKTLGAGSMGKVKLATHNQTGEKVRATDADVGSGDADTLRSSRSKFCPARKYQHPRKVRKRTRTRAR